MILTTMLFLTASCSQVVGDFCDLAEVHRTKDAELGRIMIERDVEFVRGLVVHNRQVKECE